MNELISVIVPVYNVEAYLERCLESIRRQTYKMIEIIIIDDGSTDRSGEIADAFSKREARASVFHKKNGGLSDARNIGISHATGRYITFIDSDDYIADDYVDYLYRLLKRYHVKIASSFYEIVSTSDEFCNDEAEAVEGYVTASEAIKRMLYRNGMSHNAWGKLYSRELFNLHPTIDFSEYIENEKYRFCVPIYQNQYRFPYGIINEDLALIYYLVMEAGTVAYGTKKTYFYVSNPESITKTKVRKRDFQIFYLYEMVSAIILKEYPFLKSAVLEFQETIYVKLLKRLTLNNQNEFRDEIDSIYKELRRTCLQALKSNIRGVTKIRVLAGASSRKLFLILCRVENVLGARS